MAITYGLFDPKHCIIRYVGKTIRSDEKRLQLHDYEAFGAKRRNWNRPVCRWIRKLMSEGRYPDIIVLEECETEQEALDMEIVWIARLKEDGARLLNATEGGDGISGYRHDDKSKDKIAEASRNQVWTDERKKKIGDAIRGDNHYLRKNPELHPFLGKTHSPEARRKIGEAGKGRPGPRKGVEVSQETRRRMSESAKKRKRKPRTEETKRKISEALKGRGHPQTEETRRKISLAFKKKREKKNN